MMTLTDNTIDGLVRRVKAEPAVSGFVFASAYPPADAPYPVGKYHITVENTGVKRTQLFVGSAVGSGMKGCVYEAKLRVRVYAPRKSSGAALLRASSLVADAFERADTEGLISEISLGGICYDGVTRTDHRDISVTLCGVMCREANDD